MSKLGYFIGGAAVCALGVFIYNALKEEVLLNEPSDDIDEQDDTFDTSTVLE